MIVVTQTAEIVEGNHLHVGTGESIGQLLANRVEDAEAGLLLDALGESFFGTLGAFLRCRLVTSDARMHGAFLITANVENCACSLTVDKHSGVCVWALALAFRSQELTFDEHVSRVPVCLP